MSEHFDVIVVGAGLSGVGAGRHLQARAPAKSFVILEGREATGGTWDLFRYPGIRSDSDMHTMGYAFRPWPGAKAIADGPSILDYVRETVAETGVDRHIRISHRVRKASWSTDEALWTVEAETPEGPRAFTCGFLFMCTGYYDYERPHDPEFAGRDRFGGTIVHPQFWPQDLDYAGKQVVVIGSGATAVTLVPAMAESAAKVTMVQRSPTYVVSMPAEDAMANALRRRLPANFAYALTRWRNVIFGLMFFRTARRKPEQTKAAILKMVQKELGPDYDVATHFTPRYNPWDQRLCLVPDADLFAAIRSGRVEVATGEIETFTEHGLELKDGREIAADIIVTATGLRMALLNGIELEVDGAPVELGKTLTYKGMMYSGVPNLASAFGYTNASWTLKCDLTCEHVCRLLNFMDRRGYDFAVPRRDEGVGEIPWIDFSSGYVQRALSILPRQGDRPPWKLHQNYALDLVSLRYGRIDDPALEFGRRTAEAKAA